MSTSAIVLVLKIVVKRTFSWNQSSQTDSDEIRMNERVRTSENLALYVMGNLVSQGMYFL